MRENASMTSTYFEALYASDPDPWKFASSEYEKEKYRKTLAALPRPRYVSALEIGCSIGVLTRDLARRCDALLAVDAAATPIAEAKRRCNELAQVRFAQMIVPSQWPTETFDLILLSEVIYYFTAADLVRLARKVCNSLAPRGDIVLVYWTGETNYPLPGDEAAELFIGAVNDVAILLHTDRYAEFRLDVLRHR
jgi:SAM-dependent methyltransferase